MSEYRQPGTHMATTCGGANRRWRGKDLQVSGLGPGR